MSAKDARLLVRRFLHGRTPDGMAPTFTSANRIVSSEDLLAVAAAGLVDMTEGTAAVFMNRLGKELVSEGLVAKVRRGLYLNQALDPKPGWEEAARFVRAGAVVSMHTVLGRTVTNNYSPYVHAVIPMPPSGRCKPIELAFDSSTQLDPTTKLRFFFYPMPREVIEAGDEMDRLAFGVPGSDMDPPYEEATPEAALVHWLWLGASPSSGVSPPDPQLDLGELDLDRLARLADAVGVRADADDLVERAQALDASEDDLDCGARPTF
jgi:hypothetical protein